MPKDDPRGSKRLTTDVDIKGGLRVRARVRVRDRVRVRVSEKLLLY